MSFKKIKYQIFRQVTFVFIQCGYGQICCNQPASSLSHYTVIQLLPLLFFVRARHPPNPWLG